jgi:outer membrane receptor protein involved in Fe transport
MRLTSFAEEVQVAGDLGNTHTTGSRLKLTRQDTPASVDVVTQDVIQARGADTVSTALRFTTGLTSAHRSGASAALSMRGFVENSIGVHQRQLRRAAACRCVAPRGTVMEAECSKRVA